MAHWQSIPGETPIDPSGLRLAIRKTVHSRAELDPLEAENIRVGQRLSLSAGLAQYRDLLIDRFSKEMSAEDAQNVQVQFTDPFSQAVR